MNTNIYFFSVRKTFFFLFCNRSVISLRPVFPLAKTTLKRKATLKADTKPINTSLCISSTVTVGCSILLQFNARCDWNLCAYLFSCVPKVQVTSPSTAARIPAADVARARAEGLRERDCHQQNWREGTSLWFNCISEARNNTYVSFACVYFVF